jgi:hypothetical protein
MYVIIFDLRPDEAEPSDHHLSCGQSSDRDPSKEVDIKKLQLSNDQNERELNIALRL